MILEETSVDGVVVIDLEPVVDDRGFFARAFDAEKFGAMEMMTEVVHVNLSRNTEPYTLRGLHFQDEPCPDPKIVRCVRGAIFDVAVDLRPGSPTRGQWFAGRLDSVGGRALHVPAGCAHGFLTLEPDTDVLYLMGAHYEPELARGVRWDDPAFSIEWPAEPLVISDRDRNYEDFR
jgi:dTDP-4-dehydrorhamnose 3,5-epimerase